MTLEKKHIVYIRQKFAILSSKDEFVELLTYAKTILIGKNAVPFALKQITFYSNPKVSGRQYRVFSIKKKSGKKRIIHAPVKGLTIIQRCLNLILHCVYTPHHAAKGFIAGRSIADNAQIHTGKNYVYNIDLKDFFPSVDQARVWKCLQLPPFNLIDDHVFNITTEDLYDKSEFIFFMFARKAKPNNKSKLIEWQKVLDNFIREDRYSIRINILRALKDEFISIAESEDSLETRFRLKDLVKDWWDKITFGRLNIANMIAAITCTKILVERVDENGNLQKVKKNVLPQGAPTSPIITNIICKRLDILLSGVAKRFNLKYSRYADDITFSSDHNVYQPNSLFITELNKVIKNQNFRINPTKTRLQTRHYRQEVTGLIVNEKINIPRRYIKELRMWLYYWENYGYIKAQDYFVEQYIRGKSWSKSDVPAMANVIAGKLDYLKMIKGSDSKQYMVLLERFSRLVQSLDQIDFIQKKNTGTQSTTLDITSIKAKANFEKYSIIYKNSKLEEEIKELKAIIAGDKSKDDNMLGLEIHDPKKVVWFLNKFTEDNPLKYTTHIWDKKKMGEEVVDRTNFQNIIRDLITKNEENGGYNFKVLETLRPDLYWRILNFTLGRGTNKLLMNWSNKDLIDFYISHPESQPFEYQVPVDLLPTKKLNGKYLKYFEDFVDVFKSDIEFRGNSLKRSIKTLCDKYLGFDYTVTIENLDGLSFFTDTNAVIDTFELVIRNFKGHDRSIYPDILISGNYDEVNNCIEIFFTQKKSFSDKLLADDKLRLLKGDFLTIYKKISSLCDWSILSRFRVDNKYEFYEVVYLEAPEKNGTNFTQKRKIIPIKSADGFTYKFKFYL